MKPKFFFLSPLNCRVTLIHIFVAFVLTLGLIACNQTQETPTAEPTLQPQSNAIEPTATLARQADNSPLHGWETHPLQDAVTVAGIRTHLAALQRIAETHNNTRASGTPGYDASATYIQAQLEAAGYEVTLQPFEFDFFHDATQLKQISPIPTGYYFFRHFSTMINSPFAEAEGLLQAVGLEEPLRGSSDSGCHTADFADFEPGNIALIKRGICPFAEKAANAEAAGASAVLIFNDGDRPQRERVIFGGTLGENHGVQIPVIGLSFDLGEALYQQLQTDEVILQLKAEVIRDKRETVNVIADTPTGRDDFVIVVGGHLDSVPGGPGIQDNGSGIATILEIALQMARLEIEPRNKVRFAFWGAEEFGLLGSQHYVENLSRAEREQIALNLNFDMIASPNYGRFVYDGDQSAFSAGGSGRIASPPGSEAIEQLFHEYFEQHNLTLAEIAFDGRSDYGPFIQRRIPAGGLFTGAEGIKPPDEVDDFGGLGDEAYDKCYHLPCDTIDNVNWQALDEMSNAAAHAVLIFAMTDKSIEQTVK